MPFAEKVQLNFDKLMVRKAGLLRSLYRKSNLIYGVFGFTSGLPC
jgi:hypothetical protein